MLGATRTLERIRDRCGVVKRDDPTEVTGRRAPLPTIIYEGLEEGGGWEEVSIPALLAMCNLAPESTYHSAEDGGGVRDMVPNWLIRDLDPRSR